jgi:hypothetical protein
VGGAVAVYDVAVPPPPTELATSSSERTLLTIDGGVMAAGIDDDDDGEGPAAVTAPAYPPKLPADGGAVSNPTGDRGATAATAATAGECVRGER